jgi:hypothetical protein
MKSKPTTDHLHTVFEYIPAGKPDDFWVVTACNPNGKPADPGDNLKADARLLAAIEALEITPFRVTGLSPDETRAEPGWGLACDEATALKLARRCGRRAVWHFSAGRIALVDCKTRQRHPLEDPAARVRDPRALRHFTLFVGSPAGRGRLDPLEYAGVSTRVGALFPGFTIQRAEGCFQSRFGETLLIHIATREPLKVIETAHSLRCFLNQDGIGISHNGIYQRVREWTDDGMILETFGMAR